MENDLKDYCITYTPRNLPVDETIMKIKQIFIKLPIQSAKKIADLFNSVESEFSIQPLDPITKI